MTADYFFSLSDRIKTGRLASSLSLAKTSVVELGTHPELQDEFDWLMSDICTELFGGVQRGTYEQLSGVSPIPRRRRGNE